MVFQLNYADIAVLFFLTLGPLKAMLPFARATRGTERAFRRAVAWRAIVVATAIVLGVALIGPLVLTNWHVSVPAMLITCGIILFYQALRITAQTPGERSRIGGPRDGAVAALSGHCGLSDNGDRTAPGIAAIAAIVVLNRHDFVHQAIE